MSSSTDGLQCDFKSMDAAMEFVRSSGVPMILVADNPIREVRETNVHWLKLYKFAKDSAVGHPLSKIFGENTEDDRLKRLETAMASRTPLRLLLTCYDADQQTFPYQLRMQPAMVCGSSTFLISSNVQTTTAVPHRRPQARAKAVGRKKASERRRPQDDPFGYGHMYSNAEPYPYDEWLSFFTMGMCEAQVLHVILVCQIPASSIYLILSRLFLFVKSMETRHF